jgi:hypothetical protein
VTVLAEFAAMQTAINLQDEKDRDFVSLFGALEANSSASHMQVKSSLAKERKERSKYTLNQDCISCSGTNQHQLRLFKAACLSYKSNPVLHNGELIDRP